MTYRVFLFLLMLPAAAAAQRVWFGFIGGTALTKDFDGYSEKYFDTEHPDGLSTFSNYSGDRRFLAGATVEFPLFRGFSLEADAIHRDMGLRFRVSYPNGQKDELFENVIGAWEWPVLAKYRFGHGRYRPFLEAGPSFRTRKNPGASEPSRVGITTGAGVEFRLGPFLIAPVVRYTRWQADPPFPKYATRRDQVELLTGISYGARPELWKIGHRKISIGAVAGTPFTKGIANQGWNVPERQGYIVGLMGEFEISRGLSVEADGLYRPFRIDEEWNEYTVLTWEFPVLAKYRFRANRRAQPFVEAGPSFRLSGNTNGYSPSPVGVTGGAGLRLVTGKLRIDPALRYTHWQRDSSGLFYNPVTARNQVEFLVGFSF